MGIYRVTWHISVDEPAQWALFIAPPPLFTFAVLTAALGSPSQIGQATGTSQMTGDVLISNTVAGSRIEIRNNASPAALTVTPLPGGTNAQAVVIIIQRLL